MDRKKIVGIGAGVGVAAFGIYKLLTGKDPQKYSDKWFDTVSPMKYITDQGRPVTLCHYPMLTWPGISRGGYMVYGHIHNNTGANYWTFIAANDHMLNACVDINAFVPVSLEEMITNNNQFKQIHGSDKSVSEASK